MVNVIGECAQVRVPGWVTDLPSFRRWTDSDDCPEEARVHFLEGEVWVDVSREEVFTHVGVKSELVAVLTACAKPKRSGLFLGSGVLLSNDAAGFAVKPDGLYISKQTQASGRVRWLH